MVTRPCSRPALEYPSRKPSRRPTPISQSQITYRRWRSEPQPGNTMIPAKTEWKSKDGLAGGKGATVQEFIASVGHDTFEIDVAPWGEGHLKINGLEVATIDGAKDRRQAFNDLRKIAERYAKEQPPAPDSKRKPSMIPVVKAK